MKRVAILLLLLPVALTLMVPACGRSQSDVQQAAGGVWQAELFGGDGAASGFSFVTEFTVSGAGGTLIFSNFQFLTSGECFPVNGITPTGAMEITVNTTTDQVTGPFTFTLTANGNTLTLNGSLIKGNENGIYGLTLSNAVVQGTWTLTGSSACTVNNAPTSFTMTQESSN